MQTSIIYRYTVDSHMDSDVTNYNLMKSIMNHVVKPTPNPWLADKEVIVW